MEPKYLSLLFVLNGLFFFCSKSKCQRHEKAVQDVISTVLQMVDPFEVGQQELLSLSSGAVLENDAAYFLLNIEQIGEAQFTEFAQTNLFLEKSDISTPLKKNRLPTFPSGKKAMLKNSKGKEIAVKMNRNFFARLLVVAKSREIDMKEVLSYSLGIYPVSLATASGGLVKTAKHKFFHILESKGRNDEVNIRERCNNTLIIDAMAFLQAIKGKSIQINLHPIGTVSENIMQRKL